TIPLTTKRVLRFRAIPIFDTDVMRMFTHAYGRFMELGRWHLIYGSEFRRVALRNKWLPVTANEMLTYRRPLKAFQAFELSTALVFWDERRFYLEHVISSDNQIYATSIVGGVMRGPKGILHPNDVFREVGIREMPGELSDDTSRRVKLLRDLQT
ncbi:MAG TPA: thioesterase family protein, partial [Burkholderiaceae bacterium]|nr:thioesterase family protein [Burkholderiaceae bacterium]